MLALFPSAAIAISGCSLFSLPKQPIFTCHNLFPFLFLFVIIIQNHLENNYRLSCKSSVNVRPPLYPVDTDKTPA